LYEDERNDSQVNKRSLKVHLRKASEFLAKCQIIGPYVDKGALHGCVCPWEIGESADEGAFPILEDFHDTLEAVWVWSLYTKVSQDALYRSRANWAIQYTVRNWNRFIGNKKNGEVGKSLYDCSYVLFSGTLFSSAFNMYRLSKYFITAGNHLSKYLCSLEVTDGREYYDPFWMAHCLGLAAKRLKQKEGRDVAETFVKSTIVDVRKPFTRADKEPDHLGPGGHDFFSKNANMAVALISCLTDRNESRRILIKKLQPLIPAGFVNRKVDENAWNAHLAAALGKSYSLTRSGVFLQAYLRIMDELQARDHGRCAALPRSQSFGRRESWVTFFYARACVSTLESLSECT
jgi:hypothetical protein